MLGGQGCCYSAGSFRGTADGTVSRQVRCGPANLTAHRLHKLGCQSAAAAQPFCLGSGSWLPHLTMLYGNIDTPILCT